MPKTGLGPGGVGTVNLDSYQNDSMPAVPAPLLTAKVIVPTDKKNGPPKPVSLGGKSTTTCCPDCFWE